MTTGNEQRLRSMVESLPSGAVYREGDALFFNAAVERITGHSASAIATIDQWFRALYDDQAETARARYEQDRTDGFPTTRITRLRRSDGQTRVVEFAAFREQHREVWVLHDVTERESVEDALRSSEAKLQRITDAIPGAVYQYRLEPNGAESFPFISRGVKELFGESAERIKEDVKAAFCLILPEDASALHEAIRSSARTLEPWTRDFRIRKGDSSVRWIRSSAVPEPPEADGAIVWNGVFVDVTEQKQTEEALRHHIGERARAQRELEHRAFHDPLTDLPNRNLLLDRLKQALVMRDGTRVGLLIMDLDRFKEVNDTFGHATGDALLLQIAARLPAVLRETDTIARLGGDEFAFVLPAMDSAGAGHVAERILRALDRPFFVEDRALSVGGSIGIAMCPDHGTEAQVLLQRADVAMYEAKRTGSGVAHYASERDPHNPNRLHLLGELRPAIEQQQLVLYYQPQVDLRSGKTTALEALVRWRHPQHGLMPPSEFVPIAEQSALMRPLTQWVLATALDRIRALGDGGRTLPVSVNLSMRSLADPRLPELIGNMLSQFGVEPRLLQLELTESAIMADARHALEILGRLHEMGVRLAVDDFGTGYSSLSYLHRLPIDEVKIDKSFVLGLGDDTTSDAIVKATVDLAHNLKFRVVAEGVETRRAFNRLVTLGCDVGQGYFLGAPMPPAEIVPWLERAEAAAAEKD